VLSRFPLFFYYIINKKFTLVNCQVFLLPFSRAVRGFVEEKEQKLKEGHAQPVNTDGAVPILLDDNNGGTLLTAVGDDIANLPPSTADGSRSVMSELVRNALVIGAPFAGKSTLCKVLATRLDLISPRYRLENYTKQCFVRMALFR